MRNSCNTSTGPHETIAVMKYEAFEKDIIKEFVSCHNLTLTYAFK